MTKTSGLVDYSDRAVAPANCACCGARFQPKPLGYNGRYCSVACKSKRKREREAAGLADPNKKSRQREYVRGRLRTDAEFKAKHQASTGEYRKATREWLATYKMERGCVDCGYRGHFSALQLDHEGPKSVEIANARSSIARLKAEIEAGQCKVRCANCHSIKTWERKQKPADAGSIGKGCGE